MFVFFDVIRGRELEDLDGWADSTMRFAGSEKIEYRMSDVERWNVDVGCECAWLAVKHEKTRKRIKARS